MNGPLFKVLSQPKSWLRKRISTRGYKPIYALQHWKKVFLKPFVSISGIFPIRNSFDEQLAICSMLELELSVRQNVNFAPKSLKVSMLHSANDANYNNANPFNELGNDRYNVMSDALCIIMTARYLSRCFIVSVVPS